MFRYFSATLFICYCCVFNASAANYTYDYNDNCRKAYQNYLSLHLDEARAGIIREMKANPYNLMATYVADYEDCILLLINCDRADYRQRSGHLNSRLELLEKGDKSSPWYCLCKAGVYLHWALVSTRFGEQYQAAIYFHRSFALLKENQRLFPHFEYNNVFSGLQEAVIGALPGNYKWLAAIFGMKGSIKKGTGQLASFVNTHTALQPLYAETVLYYVYTRFYLLAEQNEVWDFLNSPQFETDKNLLNTFVKVNIVLDYRKADAAIQTLKAIATEADYNKYPVFDYQMGVALLDRVDTGCIYYFRQYLEKNKSDIYIKDCRQKMALAWYLNNNMTEADHCRNLARTQGSTRSDPDKQALKFAESKVWPNKALLQARLLTAGGYYTRALSILQGINQAQLKAADKLEYLFRYGSVWQEAGDTDKALDYYRQTIEAGKIRHEQFAARAALQMGLMYEHTGKKAQAIAMYKECLDMPAHDFQNSIDQQAKAGINRIEGK